MTDPMIGHVVRTLRVRHGWRQVDLARRARVSPATVARIERGQLGEIALDRLRRVLVALGGRMDVIARSGAGDLDRLLGARHAAMHELIARRFHGLPEWEIAPEVSFSIYGERGVIDVLAWHAASRTLLIIELKTEIVDVNELMAKADQRRRLATDIAVERGWRPAAVAVWIVVADSRTNRPAPRRAPNGAPGRVPDRRALGGRLAPGPARTDRRTVVPDKRSPGAAWDESGGHEAGATATPTHEAGGRIVTRSRAVARWHGSSRGRGPKTHSAAI